MLGFFKSKIGTKMKKNLSSDGPAKLQERLLEILSSGGNLLLWVVPILVDFVEKIESKNIIPEIYLACLGICLFIVVIVYIAVFNVSWWFLLFGFAGYLFFGILLQYIMKIALRSY